MPSITRSAVAPFALLAASAFAFGGCDGDTASGTSPTTTGTPAQEAAAEAGRASIAVDAAMLDDGSHPDDGGGFWLYATATERSFPRPVDSLLRIWGARVDASCVTATSAEGSVVDDDRDGVPASWDGTFRCTGQILQSRMVSVRGRVVVEDASDADAHAGFKVSYDAFAVRVQDENGVARSRTLNGTATLEARGVDFLITQNVENVMRLERPESPSVEATYTGPITAVYTPDASVAGSDPFAVGSVIVAGRATLEEGGLFYALDRSASPPLHWNRGCRGASPAGVGYDEGVFQVASSGGLRARVEFRSCADVRTSF